jgi:hypothetical protein
MLAASHNTRESRAGWAKIPVVPFRIKLRRDTIVVDASDQTIHQIQPKKIISLVRILAGPGNEAAGNSR